LLFKQVALLQEDLGIARMFECYVDAIT
jgi:hypothetical protein